MKKLIWLAASLLVACNASTSETTADPVVAAQVAVIQERIDATNSKDWERWEALHTPDACRTAPELAEPLCGRGAMRAAIETLSHAFADYRLEVNDAVGNGQVLSVRLHTSGTMTGDLVLGDGTVIPPTGKHIEQDWVALVHFDGDRIVQFDEFYDQYGLLVQLGLLEGF